MACVTTCQHCGTCYEESSEENANAPAWASVFNRCCSKCRTRIEAEIAHFNAEIESIQELSDAGYGPRYLTQRSAK